MLSDLIQKIYANIDRIRKIKKLSQEEMVQKSGLSYEAYVKNKNRNRIDIKTIESISTGLDTKITEIVKTEDDKTPVDHIEEIQALFNKLCEDKKEQLSKK